jgi:uncharacterized membrane protein YcaP (DUF421 family)
MDPVFRALTIYTVLLLLFRIAGRRTMAIPSRMVSWSY